MMFTGKRYTKEYASEFNDKAVILVYAENNIIHTLRGVFKHKDDGTVMVGQDSVLQSSITRIMLQGR